MDWEEYYNLAEDLAKCDSEASMRSAMSRAYYAVFNMSKEYLAAKVGEVDSSVADSHNAMWDVFESHGNLVQEKELLEVVSKGKTLKASRRMADYDNELNGSVDKQVKFCLLNAKRCITIINKRLEA